MNGRAQDLRFSQSDETTLYIYNIKVTVELSAEAVELNVFVTVLSGVEALGKWQASLLQVPTAARKDKRQAN